MRNGFFSVYSLVFFVVFLLAGVLAGAFSVVVFSVVLAGDFTDAFGSRGSNSKPILPVLGSKVRKALKARFVR